MALIARYASMAILMVIGIFGSIVYVIAEIPLSTAQLLWSPLSPGL